MRTSDQIQNPAQRGGRSMSFARFPSELLGLRLGLNANVAFVVLAYHDKKNEGVVFPSLPTIVRLPGISINTAHKALSVLTSTGGIEIRQLKRNGSISRSGCARVYSPTDFPRDMVSVSLGATVNSCTVALISKERPIDGGDGDQMADGPVGGGVATI
jgi:hypothetical protein